jgi:hypothetical protein
MKVTRQVPEPIPTISIHDISVDLAEKIMCLLGVVESRHNDEISLVYKELQKALNKRMFGPSIYEPNVIGTITFSKRKGNP